MLDKLHLGCVNDRVFIRYWRWRAIRGLVAIWEEVGRSVETRVLLQCCIVRVARRIGKVITFASEESIVDKERYYIHVCATKRKWSICCCMSVAPRPELRQ